MEPVVRTGPVSVCYVIDRLSLAGTETQLLHLIRGLDRNCVAPSLVLLDGTESESRRLLPDDCPVLCLGVRKLLGTPTWGALQRIGSFWRQHQVELTQSYFFDSAYFVAAARTLHRGIAHWRVRNNTGYSLTPSRRIVDRIAGVTVDRYLTNSPAAAVDLRTHLRVSEHKITTIPNGVDLDRFAAVPTLRRIGECPTIGLIGNLRPIKNVEGFIRMADRIRRRHPNARFVVAGEGEDRGKLESLIRELTLSEHVRLLGAVQDVPGFLSTVDVLVQASHSESLSNAMLEGMAAGRAIVATEVGATAEVVRHEVDGLIVKSGTPELLADAVLRLLADPNAAMNMARSARERVKERYGRTRWIRDFEELYTKSFRHPEVDSLPDGKQK